MSGSMGWRLGWLLVAAALVGGCASRMWSPEGTTTVVLLRHAERTTVTKELTQAGRERAAALPAAVADLDIVAIYSPDLARNIDTVRPLAEQRGLTIIRVPAKPDVVQVTRRLLHEHPGRTVLWVGNTTNLDRIYPDLGGVGDPPDNYGDLFVLQVPERGDTRVERRHFGR